MASTNHCGKADLRVRMEGTQHAVEVQLLLYVVNNNVFGCVYPILRNCVPGAHSLKASYLTVQQKVGVVH